MKLSIPVATSIACLLITNLVNAEEPERVDIKSVYSMNNSLPSAAEMRNISQAINEYYRKRNARSNSNNSPTVNRDRFVVFEEVKDIALIEFKISPTTRSKVAKVEIHILERGYSRSVEQVQNTSSGADRKLATNNNTRDKYLWKLDRERIIEGKLIINRDEDNTWKVTGTAMGVKTSKSIK